MRSIELKSDLPSSSLAASCQILNECSECSLTAQQMTPDPSLSPRCSGGVSPACTIG